VLGGLASGTVGFENKNEVVSPTLDDLVLPDSEDEERWEVRRGCFVALSTSGR
jgi:hypothetical protein